jgi:NADPH:quinone reductase-like Zn-dependent oxidoreductase
MTNPADNAVLVGEVVAALADGTLNPVEPETHPLSDAGSVLRSLLERQVIGKVALIP